VGGSEHTASPPHPHLPPRRGEGVIRSVVRVGKLTRQGENSLYRNFSNFPAS